MVVTGAAVLLLIVVACVAGGLLIQARAAGNYSIGSCVAPRDGKPHRVICESQGAFRVVSKVDDPSRCDPQQPYIEVDHQPHNTIYCLRPVR
jgi:hypothetical protein